MSAEKQTPNFAERYLAFRRDVSQMNWDADGTNANQGYTYLSEEKIKGQLAPALVKNDLGLKTDYSELQILEPIGSMKQHYCVKITLMIFDGQMCTDDCPKIVCQAYGEGADSGDKAISKTQTNALKNAIANNLLLSSYSVAGEDAMESKASASVNQEPPKFFSKAVKQEAKEILQQTNPANAPAQPTSSKGINAIQSNAMEKIMGKLRVAEPSKLEILGGLAEIEIEMAKVKQSNDPAEAAKFIQKYKAIV